MRLFFVIILIYGFYGGFDYRVVEGFKGHVDLRNFFRIYRLLEDGDCVP